MSTFNEKITLVNGRDRARAFHGHIPAGAVRTVDAYVDTGAWNLILNEDVRSRLGLGLEGSEFSTLAGGTTEAWENRTLNAQVISSAMEALDVVADMVEARHGDKPLCRLK